MAKVVRKKGGKIYEYDAKYVNIYLHPETKVFYDVLKESGMNMGGAINNFIKQEAMRKFPELLSEIEKVDVDG